MRLQAPAFLYLLYRGNSLKVSQQLHIPGYKHKLCPHVFDKLRVSSEEILALYFGKNSISTHVTFKEGRAKTLSMEVQ